MTFQATAYLCIKPEDGRGVYLDASCSKLWRTCRLVQLAALSSTCKTGYYLLGTACNRYGPCAAALVAARPIRHCLPCADVMAEAYYQDLCKPMLSRLLALFKANYTYTRASEGYLYTVCNGCSQANCVGGYGLTILGHN